MKNILRKILNFPSHELKDLDKSNKKLNRIHEI